MTFDPQEIADSEFTRYRTALKRDIDLAGYCYENILGVKPVVDAYIEFIDTYAPEIFYVMAVDRTAGAEFEKLLRAMSKFITGGHYALSPDEHTLLGDIDIVIHDIAKRYTAAGHGGIGHSIEVLARLTDNWLGELWHLHVGHYLQGSASDKGFAEKWLDRPGLEAFQREKLDEIMAKQWGNGGYVPPTRRPWESGEEYISRRWAAKLGFGDSKSPDDIKSAARYYAGQFIERFGAELKAHEDPAQGIDDQCRMLRFGINKIIQGGILVFPKRLKDALDDGELILRRAGMKDAADLFATHIRPGWREIKGEMEAGRSSGV